MALFDFGKKKDPIPKTREELINFLASNLAWEKHGGDNLAVHVTDIPRLPNGNKILDAADKAGLFRSDARFPAMTFAGEEITQAVRAAAAAAAEAERNTPEAKNLEAFIAKAKANFRTTYRSGGKPFPEDKEPELGDIKMAMMALAAEYPWTRTDSGWAAIMKVDAKAQGLTKIFELLESRNCVATIDSKSLGGPAFAATNTALETMINKKCGIEASAAKQDRQFTIGHIAQLPWNKDRDGVPSIHYNTLTPEEAKACDTHELLQSVPGRGAMCIASSHALVAAIAKKNRETGIEWVPTTIETATTRRREAIQDSVNQLPKGETVSPSHLPPSPDDGVSALGRMERGNQAEGRKPE